MLILIILLPLLGFLSGSLFGRFLSKGVCFITTFNVFLSLIFSIFLFIDILSSGSHYKVILGSWILVD
jgi:NADH:ubiquinone oxidoreductase subunit 5 (subunit L)/multisubunit Na+/H+ antiporter MnhA subunit